jgi:hypothetical protein
LWKSPINFTLIFLCPFWVHLVLYDVDIRYFFLCGCRKRILCTGLLDALVQEGYASVY